MRYSIVDLGTKYGGAIDVARKHSASMFGLPAPDPACCLGVDRSSQHAKIVTSNGYQFLAADVLSSDFNWPQADLYLAFDFLEHLPSVNDSQNVLRKMLDQAAVGVWLRMPSFEQDCEGEGQLRSVGLRFSWTDWTGHPSAFTLDAMEQVAQSSPRCCGIQKHRRRIITSSNDRSVLPLSAPCDTVEYDTTLGERPVVAFDPPVVGQWEIILRCRP